MGLDLSPRISPPARTIARTHAQGKRRTVGGDGLNSDESLNGGRTGGRRSARKKMVIINADMEEDLQKDAVDCATRAMDEFNADTVKKRNKKHGSSSKSSVG